VPETYHLPVRVIDRGNYAGKDVHPSDLACPDWDATVNAKGASEGH
jgi:hypothetical protein